MQFKTSFIDLYEELSVLQEIVEVPAQSMIKSDFERAKAFVDDYINNSGGSFIRPVSNKSTNTKKALINIAFSAPHLARYYEQNAGDSEKISNLEALLNILGYKLKGDRKSLQYLYHAIVQEHYLVTEVAPNKLKRNPEATHAKASDMERAYWYLFSDNSDVGIKTNAPDFKLEGTEYTIDAKIYGSEASMQSKLSTEAAHEANFVIVYLIGDRTWRFLYTADGKWNDWLTTNGAELYKEPDINMLANKVYSLGELYFRYAI